jgi:hypothetical protein
MQWPPTVIVCAGPTVVVAGSVSPPTVSLRHPGAHVVIGIAGQNRHPRTLARRIRDDLVFLKESRNR